jgi:carbonic anhydrase/acetyltransferase-like protein (isoleucine patch superfamily)
MTLASLDGVTVQTPPSGNYWVAPNALVIGNVILEEDTSIWFNTVLRGDNEPIRLGAGSNIQEGCVLHTDPGYPMHIEPECLIGHMAMLHGCTIKTGSLIGIGSVILNGAVIGEECLIGAGSLIPEGKVIPPRSLVMGTPGKVVRQVTDADVENIKRGVAGYKRNWRRFKAGMQTQPE